MGCYFDGLAKIFSSLVLAAVSTTASLDLLPTYEVLENTEVVWQKPLGKPRALLLIAHGCSHSAVDFWPRSERCPTCLGLPQEVNITRTALSRGWAVLAVSSADRERRRCWRPSPPQAAPSQDTLNVKSVLAAWLEREIGDQGNRSYNRSNAGQALLNSGYNTGSMSNSSSSFSSGSSDSNSNNSSGSPSRTLAALVRRRGSAAAAAAALPSTSVLHPTIPVFGLGASSGGAFILLLAMNGVHFSGVCSEVMAVPQMLLYSHVSSQKARGVSPVFPPTVFVHMPKDVRTAQRVRVNMELLKGQGVPVKEAAVLPRPLIPDHLHIACGPEVSLEQSRAIYAALSSAGYLSQEGMLKQDPRQSAWRMVLKDAKVPGITDMRLEADASPVAEELNLLWARHEIVSTTVSETIDWFELKGGQNPM